MGSGKTTLGRALSKSLSIPFIDLDALLEAVEEKSILRILSQQGESVFRRVEERVLDRVCAEVGGPRVIATGGGIVETPTAAPKLQALGRIVWLQASADDCWQRAQKQDLKRPLLNTKTWRQRFSARQELYAALADDVVDTTSQALEASLAALMRIARKTEET